MQWEEQLILGAVLFVIYWFLPCAWPCLLLSHFTRVKLVYEWIFPLKQEKFVKYAIAHKDYELGKVHVKNKNENRRIESSSNGNYSLTVHCRNIEIGFKNDEVVNFCFHVQQKFSHTKKT